MADLESVNAMMTQAVPFNRVLGIRVTAIEPERAEVTLLAAPERLNHVGTIHAAAQFGLGEAASGAMVVSAFDDVQAEGFVPLAAEATITYRRAASGDLRAVATLTREEQERIRRDVHESGRARFTIPVRLLDSAGTVTTEMDVGWALVPKRT